MPLSDRSPCLTVPRADLPVGARFLCLAALLLVRGLAAWEHRRCR